METLLREIASGGVCDDFSVLYSDMHGLWGGLTLSLIGTGMYERIECPRGAATSNTIRGIVEPQYIREIIALLLEIKVWEQRIPERPRLPDDSRATIVIRCADTNSCIWEEYNTLQNNQRIIRVRDYLYALGEQHMLGAETQHHSSV